MIKPLNNPLIPTKIPQRILKRIVPRINSITLSEVRTELILTTSALVYPSLHLTLIRAHNKNILN
jgi:hypothetical protein